MKGNIDEQMAEFVQCFDRLNTLAEIRFKRPLSSKELQELFELRVDLPNRLSGWLKKR